MVNLSVMDGMHDNAMPILENLIRFDTTSSKSNLELVQYVEEYLLKFGVKSTLIYDQSGMKANLFATIGPLNVPGVILSGHTDVVPIDGQKWTKDPFSMNQSDGKVFGRGAADMKGFIACALSWVPQMVDAELTSPIHFALSYDEEVGCIGARQLLSLIEKMAVRPAIAIIGEPTNMCIVTGHKGKQSIRVKIRGASAHSAYPTEGVNSIEIAARLIEYIGELQVDITDKGPFDSEYRVPHTTLHVGTIKGGTVLNIVPSECTFDFEIRHLPEHDIEPLICSIKHYAREVLEPKMQCKNTSSGINFKTLSGYPALSTSPDAASAEFAYSLLNIRISKSISFGSEAGLFSQQAGIPSVVLGPGSIQQAHKPDEYVTIEQLRMCSAMFPRLIEMQAKL